MWLSPSRRQPCGKSFQEKPGMSLTSWCSLGCRDKAASLAMLWCIFSWQQCLEICFPKIPARKEQSHARGGGEGLLEPPSQIYSLQPCHCAVHSFCLGKKIVILIISYSSKLHFLDTIPAAALRVLFSTGSSSPHDTPHSVPAAFFPSTAGKKNHFYSAFGHCPTES